MPALLNVRKAVIAALQADAGVTALIPADRISHRKEAPWPRMFVTRVGGAGDAYYLDKALVQIEAIGEPNDLDEDTQDRLEAAIAAAVNAVWTGMRWSTTSGLRVSEVDVLTASQDSPAEMPNQARPKAGQLRVFCRLLITCHALV